MGRRVYKQSLEGLIYSKHSRSSCYQRAPCDHQRTCVRAAGVTQHLGLLPSSLLASVCIFLTHKESLSCTCCPLALTQMVLFISHSAEVRPPFNPAGLTLTRLVIKHVISRWAVCVCSMYASCDGADSCLIFHVSLSVNWCNLKRLMPQINPKSFHSLSLLYPLCSLTFPIFYWPPPLLVCLLSLPTPSCVFGSASLSWSSLLSLSLFFIFLLHAPTSTHPHSHSPCDFFPSGSSISPHTLLSSSSLFSSLSHPPFPVALGRNQPLKRERPKWKSDYPMTEGQLRSKRDEFWDTAPAFEGRKEIWDALRAAASAFESNDHLLAQAILDGASITLPHGNTH